MRTRVVEDGPAEEKEINGAKALADATGGVLVPAWQSGKQKDRTLEKVELDEFVILWEVFPDPLREGQAWSDFIRYCLQKLADALIEAAEGGPLFIEDCPIGIVLQPLKQIERLEKDTYKETTGLFVGLRCWSNVSAWLRRKDRSRDAKAFGAGF